MILERALILFFFSFLIVSSGGAALIVESSLQEEGKTPVPSRLTMDTSAGLRSESGEGVFIFRTDKQVLWTLDTARKEYTQITETELSQMSSRMDEAMKQMREQLAQLSPEQRAKVEELVKEQLPGGIPEEDAAGALAKKSTFEKSGWAEKVGEWTCDKYVEKQNGLKMAEIWTVSPDTFSSFSRYFTMLQKLGSFFGKLPAAQGKLLEFPMLKASRAEEDTGLSGIPVKEIHYRTDGGRLSQWQLKKISEEPADPQLFELPKNYIKRSLMEENN